MTKVAAALTVSVDGYYTGPDDGPGRGLGVGGERLHYWVFGGPWSYESGPRGQAEGEDAAVLEEGMSRAGAVVIGRWMYEAAGAWGGQNPWDLPVYVVTHRPGDQPDESAGFRFVDGLVPAVEQARQAAGEKDVNIGGGGDVIRQAIRAGLVDELTVIIAPVVLGGGKRLFDGFEESIDLTHAGLRQSPRATFITYRVGER
jgi:dihydrofolate reductase